jgi:poly(beta-D-mannuronate) lyase
MRRTTLVLALALLAGATPPARAAAASCTADLPAPRRTLRVGTAAELAARVRGAQPGDLILAAPGTYRLSEPLRIESSGTEAAPLVIAGETIGAATVTGYGGLHLFHVSHVIVCGLTFTASPWDATKLPRDVRGYPGAEDEIADAIGVLVDGSHHVRITRNTLELHDETPNAFWLLVSGEGSASNRVDHNLFHDKTSKNCFLAVYGPAGGVSQNDQIDHNHFSHHGYRLEGGEAVRHGNGGRAPWSSHAVYEYNLWEKCNGDPEALSMKSSDNVVRFNTVRKSHGGIVLRHGDRNVVQGNFILDNEGGIRMYGDEHRIVDNYIAGNVGVGSQGSIVLLSGGTEDDTGWGMSQNRPTGVVIEHNTLVDNRFSNLDVGGPLPLLPRRCRIDENIIQGDYGRLFALIKEPEDCTWSGNILWGAAASGDTSSGYVRRDPRLAKDEYGIYRPPAGEKAGAQHPGGALGRPLTPEDVGPLAP